jgi:hypothetical protein
MDETILQDFWDNKLSLIEKKNILSNNHFWDGLLHYSYNYIPSDLKLILWLKTQENA